MKKIFIILSVLVLTSSMFFMCSSSESIELDDETFDDPTEKIDMVSVSGGTYVQEDTDGNRFEHTISDFYVGKFEVTYELWYAVYKWATHHGYSFASNGREGRGGMDGEEPTDFGKHYPVTNISWRDAIVWCNAYSEKSKLTPVYEKDGNVIRDSSDSNGANCDDATMKKGANGYRLLTEGEWQYAASYRDGTDFTPYNYASGATADCTDADACKEVAWYRANSGSATHSVGEKTANALGLHDMSGNVWEWCWDRYGDYPNTASTDYSGPSSGPRRVVRGGNWYFKAVYLRIGCRIKGKPDLKGSILGFRLARATS